MRKLFFATLFGSTTVLAAAATAQQAQTPQQQTPAQPGIQQQQTEQEQRLAPSDLELQGGFVLAQRTDQIMGSNLMRAHIIGADNQRIGSVDDVLVDAEGRIVAVIVGIGGFLGIGQRDVGIPVGSLEFVLHAVAPGVTGTAPRQPATRVTRTTPGPAGATGAGRHGTTGWGRWGTGAWEAGQIHHIRVAFTRAQLEAAPEFRRIH